MGRQMHHNQCTTKLSRKSQMPQENLSKLVTMGDHAFSLMAPEYWNELMLSGTLNFHWTSSRTNTSKLLF